MSNWISKPLILSLALAGLSSQSLAQTKSLSDLQGLETSRDRSNSPSQVVILNNSPSSSQQQDSYQKTNSSARNGWGTGESLEYLRNHRMRKEAQNEQALMEKLEESRVDDERSRLERLFRIREFNQRQQQMQQNTHQPDPVVIVQPDVVQNSAPSAPSYQASNTSYEKTYTSSVMNNWYVRGQAGLGTYNAENTESSFSWGIGIGKKLSSKLHVEFNYLSSNYTVDDPRGNYEVGYYGDVLIEPSNFRDLTQSNYSGVVGYNILVNPMYKAAIRGGVSYVRRSSESSNIADFSKVDTDAIDVIIGASADVELAKNTYVVGSFDYFTNISNDLFETSADDATRVEVSDYFVVGVGLKYEF